MKMPEDTISPLLVALALMLLFFALVFQLMWVALAGDSCYFVRRLLLDVAASQRRSSHEHRGSTCQSRRIAGCRSKPNAGHTAMMCTILTEAFLFIALFASYFMLGSNKDRWRIEELPKLHYALPMLWSFLSAAWCCIGARSK